MHKTIKKCSWGAGIWVIVWGSNEANVRKAAATIAVMTDGTTVTLPSDLQYTYVSNG